MGDISKKLLNLIAYILVFAIGFGFGYGTGREDLSLAQKRKAVVREALAQLRLSNEDQERMEWDEVVDKIDRLTDQCNTIIDSWDGENIENVNEMISCFKEIEKLLLDSNGPPNAKWYSDGLSVHAQKRIKAFELMKTGIQKNSDKLIRESSQLENEAIAEFAELTEKYDKWLKENSY